jgi:hypothetical protein
MPPPQGLLLGVFGPSQSAGWLAFRAPLLVGRDRPQNLEVSLLLDRAGSDPRAGG